VLVRALAATRSPPVQVPRSRVLRCMSLFGLNHEVLDQLFSLLTKRSLCSLGLTCHTARWITLPALLQDVTLTADHQVRQFCEFVLGGRFTHATLIRALAIEESAFLTFHLNDIGFPTPFGVIDFAAKLANVLEHACNITSLRIARLDSLILQEPRIRTALQGCNSLLKVTFNDVGPRAIQAMVNMTHVRQARLAVTGCADVMSILRPFQLSLEDVLIASPGLESICIDEHATWPNVHTLRVHHAALSRSRLVRAFPRVRHLGVGVYQHLYGPKDAPNCPNWPSLDSVEGDAVALRSLPLTCPVRKISAVVYESEDCRAALLDVLQATSPTVLCCTVVPSMSEEFFVAMNQRCPGLQALELSLSCFIAASDGEFITLLVSHFLQEVAFHVN
jgi:hypothetical protein